MRKIILLLLLSFLILYGLWYRAKVLPGVFLGNVSFSGKSQQEAAEYLAELLAKRRLAFFVDESGRREELGFSYSDLGIEYDAYGTAARLYEAGRGPGFLGKLFWRLKAPFVKTRVLPVYRVDSSRFAAALEGRLAQLIVPASDASIVYDAGFKINGEIPGKTYDRSKLVEQVKSNIENLENYPITVKFIETLPGVTSQNSRAALEKVKTLQTQKIVLAFERERWNLSGTKLLESLKYVPVGRSARVFVLEAPNHPVRLGPFYFAGAKPSTLEVSMEESPLDGFVEGIGSALDVETVDASLVFEEGKITQFTAARDGRRLDRKLTRQLILSRLSVESVSGQEEIVINLPVSVEKARIASDEINSFGIKELIGRGVSYFAGSIPNRIHNLSLGSARISGTIVKPDETFSFNRAVGEVSGATGYKPAYVISSGRTVLDDGGGICQVSTTVFRAALEAGLPILARTAHAYRVGYYEQKGFKPGLDVTVWAPAVDLVFKNNTGNHILVQAVVDPKNAKLEVDIYGTADGRRVEISEPVVSNVKPAPEPRYQDDPTLPAGTTKQVDFAAPGAASVFTRKVYTGDELIIDDVFKSVYRPWQAVYLVGTGG